MVNDMRIFIPVVFLSLILVLVGCRRSQKQQLPQDGAAFEVAICETVPFSEARFDMFPEYDDYEKATQMQAVLPYRDCYAPADTAAVNEVLELNSISQKGYRHAWLTKKAGNTSACELIIYRAVPVMSEKVGFAQVSDIPDDREVCQVAFTFSDREKFHTVTRSNINRKLAMLVDGEVVCAPTVMNEIESGNCAVIIPRNLL